ncbi:MAG: MCE family protein [Deltaproteobacteria bacterium]|nr:MCE family protein [Deltaproteobacteria bacterium]
MSTAQERSRATDIKVGLFVTAGIVVLFLSIFLIGQERNLFETPAFLKARFQNVAGLKVGARVHLAGVPVGIVSKVEFPALDPEMDRFILDPHPALDLKPKQALAVKIKKFDGPTNVTVSGHDDEAKLVVRIRFSGRDPLGKPVEENITLAMKGTVDVKMGRLEFLSLDKVTVVKVENATSGDSIQIGVGRSRKITVEMRVSKEILPRIRHDSLAKVDSDGLLGDKTIDVSLGSSQFPEHKDGDLLRSGQGMLDKAMGESEAILANIRDATDEVMVLVRRFSEDGHDKTVFSAFQTVEELIKEVKEGNGLAHKIIYDDKTGKEADKIIEQLRLASIRLNRTIAKVDGMVGEVKTGKGLVHELIYGQNGEATLLAAKTTIDEANTLLKDVREKNGVVHQLIYTDDSGELIGNITEASKEIKVASSEFRVLAQDARLMVADVKKGKGTIGGLVVDPSVYEDLKILLGNVKRNDAVKSLVRFSIASQGDE